MAGILDLLGPEDIERLRAQGALGGPSGTQMVERNMKQVAPAMKEVFGERLPNAALEGPKGAAPAAAGRGILGGLGRLAASAPVAGAQAALHSAPLNEGEDEDLAKQQEAERLAYYTANPEEARSAMAFGQGVADRAVGAAGIGGRGAPSPTLGVAQPQAAAPEMAVDPEQIEKAKFEAESKRQVVQQGTVKALETNQVSRPKLAEEVVKADAQREGRDLTPDQFKQEVAQETKAMSSMDNKDLGQYVSYALIAGGLIAAFADKSGRAGDMFSSSMNKQLDRNLANTTKQAELQQKTAAANQKAAIETYKLKQGDRKLDNDTARTEGQLGYWEEQGDLGRERIDVAREGNAASQANAGATLGLRQQQADLNKSLFELRKQDSDRDYEMDKANLAVKQQKAGSEGGIKAPELSSTSANEMVKQVTKEAGTKLSKGAQAAVAEQVRVLQKADPVGFARNPAAAVQIAITKGGYTKEAGGFFSDDKYVVPKAVRQPK